MTTHSIVGVVFRSSENLITLEKVSFNSYGTGSENIQDGWTVRMTVRDGKVISWERVSDEMGYAENITELYREAKELREKLLAQIKTLDDAILDMESDNRIKNDGIAKRFGFSNYLSRKE